jgi:cytochrome b
MKRILIWDLPTRLFHALLAASFVGAFVIANVADDESSAFRWHMLLGGVMAFMVALRVIWGFVGSRWARFSSFVFGPGAVIEYFQSIVTGEGKRYPGHNPGASWGIYLMLALSLGLAITGVSMGTGGELAEELHEVMAFALAAVVGAHVLGVVLHTVRHRDNIIASMVHGYKEGEPEDAIPRSHPLVGVVFLALTGAWTYGVVTSYSGATNQVTLPVLGTVISLGDTEAGERGQAEPGDRDDDHDEDHD